jgi:predicted porin
MLAIAVVAGIAATSFAGTAKAADDPSLTWNGITLYGVVDIGVAYQNHATPYTDVWYPGAEWMISRNSNKSVSGVVSNPMSQSRVGLRAKEEINDEVSFVGNVEMGFQPTSGQLGDAPKSLIGNNGVALANQKSGGDGSLAGQFFNRGAYGGFSTKNYGTLTFGRQNSLGLDNIGKYDPMNASYALSIIGYSGVAGGFGNTENARLDDTVKYTYKYDMFHLAALYQFGKTNSSPGEAYQLGGGFDYAGFSVDVAYGKKKDAISEASLSAAQVATAGVPFNSVASTISDNEGWQLLGSYTNGPWKVSGGYERIDYSNPSLAVAPGFAGLGGYWISFTNNAAFPHDKILKITWLGLKYNITKDLDITGAWYGYDQNAYGVVKCSNTSAATCSGNEDVWSVRLDYRLTKRFDIYAGAQTSSVSDGLASGFLFRRTVAEVAGFRFQF